MAQVHYPIVVVGAGTGGIMVSANLVRAYPGLKGKIVVLDPVSKHYYQPLWTLVGGGVTKKEASEREMASVIPEGVDWIKDAVTTFDPKANMISTKEGKRISYQFLVVAAGIEINWDGIKGLKEALGSGGVCSNYSYDYCDYTWETIRNFKGGTAIFTHPSTAVKCGGAPQKIMYLADDAFRKAGVRDRSKVIFAAALDSIFHVPAYAKTLEQVVQRKQITPMYKRNLIEVRPDQKEAVFENLETKRQEVLAYDMLHVTPPMQSPAFIRNSPLADSNGWVDVDPYTLQHRRYQNIFALGDCANLPTSKTGAAIRKQAPVVAENLVAAMQGGVLTAQYDGYTSCPLVTGYNRLVMAEFDYNKQPKESFPIDQSQERFSMYLVKKDLLPVLYWNGMLKGLM
jgi:sulfide:quinone oxidoreductase